jgi:hypothetical protein
MNIQTVAQNLRNTVAGKEMLLDSYKNPSVNPYPKFVKEAMIDFLEVNINELKRILADVEKCVEKDVEQSWRDNPDRMGGQFTQDEIDNANRW